MSNKQDNLYKIIAVGLVAGVAKALFGPPPPDRIIDVSAKPKVSNGTDIQLVKDEI